MTDKEFILYELLTKTIVPKHVLGAHKARYVSTIRHIASLINAGYVEEKQITMTGARVKHKDRPPQMTISYLSLTKSGYAYAIKKLANEVPWLTYLTEPSVYSCGRKPYVQLAERTNELQSTTASIMADMIGAEETIITLSKSAPSSPSSKNSKSASTTLEEMPSIEDYDDDDWDEFNDFDDADISTGKLIGYEDEWSDFEDADLSASADEEDSPFSEYVEKAENAYYAAYSKGRKKAGILFYTSRDLKKVVRVFVNAQSNVIEAEAYDYMSSRFIGRIDSPIRSAMIYESTVTKPLLWTSAWMKREVRTELETRLAIREEQTAEGRQREYETTALSAILHVPNVKSFLCSYHSQAHANEKGEIKYRKRASLGAGYDVMYVVPETYEGVQEYRDIMTRKVEADTDTLDADLERTPGIIPNQTATNHEYPYMTSSGEFLAGLPHLEVRGLQILQKRARESARTDARYVIACADWMAPYVEAATEADANIRVVPVSAIAPHSVFAQPLATRPAIELVVSRERRWQAVGPD